MDDDDDWDDAVWSSIAALEASHKQQQQQQPPAAAAPASATWACRSCTLLNAAERATCLVCHTARGHQFAPTAAPPLSQAAAKKTVQATLPFGSREPPPPAHSHANSPSSTHQHRQKKNTAGKNSTNSSRPPTSAWPPRPPTSAPNLHVIADESAPSAAPTLAQIARLRNKGEDPAARQRYLADDDITPPTLPPIDREAAQSFIYPTNYAVREYQLAIAEKALYHNTIVSLPTGLGKTLIASVVMFNFYRWFPRGQIVFMAPTKPLVAQQIGACHEIMGIPVADTAELQGSVPPPVRETLWKTKRVFFCTPQSLQNDLQRGICDARRLVCLVVDEAHRATGNYAYCTVIEQIEAHTRRFRVLALSATPGAKFDVIQDVIRNLRITHIESRAADDGDVKSYTHARQEEVIKCSLSSHIAETKTQLQSLFQRVLPRLAANHILPHADADRLTKFLVLQMREKFRSSAQYATHRSAEGDLTVLLTLLHARDLLTGHGLRALVAYLDKTVAEASDQSNKVTWAKKQLLQSTEFQSLRLGLAGVTDAAKSDSHPKLLKLREVLHEHFQRHASGQSSTRAIVFTQFRSSVQEIVALLGALAPLVKAQQFVGQGATGKDKQSKGQSQKEQQEIVRKFRAGHFNVLVATCIAEEGLDIGEVDLIVSFDALTSPVRMIQRMGRTGRKRVGRVVILVTEGEEEKKLARSVAAAKTVSRALTTFKSKFTYATCPRMLPRGVEPELVPLAMEIPEFHASQVAGKQQHQPQSSASAGEKRDPWRLNEFERSIVRGKYAPVSVWGDGPRHEIVPLVARRTVLLRRRRRGERGGTRGRSRMLRELVRRVHGVAYDDEDKEEEDEPMQEEEEQELRPVMERVVDEEMLAFSDADAELDTHFSPPYEPLPPERSDSLSSKAEASPPRKASVPSAKTTPSPSPQRSTSASKRTPSPKDRRSAGDRRGRRKGERPRDAIDDKLLARGDALLSKLHALVMSDVTTTEEVPSPEPEPRVEDHEKEEETEWPRVAVFPRSIARRLAFDGEAAERDNCVPLPPCLDGGSPRKAEDLALPSNTQRDDEDVATTQPVQTVVVDLTEPRSSVHVEAEKAPATVATSSFSFGSRPRRSLALRRPRQDSAPVEAPPPPVLPSVPQPSPRPPPAVPTPPQETRTPPQGKAPRPLPVPSPLPSSSSSSSSSTARSQGAPCSICSEPESFDDDPIVFCDGCDVAVHQFCYGIQSLPSGDWFCDACQDPTLAAKAPSSRRCALCPIRSAAAAIKPTSCGQWVHIQCYLWIPELQFQYTASGLQLESLARLDPDRRALSCALCRSTTGGGVVQCAHKRCLAAFHVGCAAAAASQRYQLVQIDRDDLATVFVAFCPLHNDSSAVWRPPTATPPPAAKPRALSPSALLASQPQDATKKQWRRLKRKYDASQREASPSPWSKRVKRSARHSIERREHHKAMARIFIEDQVDAPSSEDEYGDERDEEMDEADRDFINDSSQLLYSPSTATPEGSEEKKKRKNRHSLGDMRAIYARSLLESPPLQRGRSRLPTGGIIDACLQEMEGQAGGGEEEEEGDSSEDEEEEDTATTTELASGVIEIDADEAMDDEAPTPAAQEASAPSFSLLGAPIPVARESPVRQQSTDKEIQDAAIADEAAQLQERIQANRLRALRLLEARKQAQPASAPPVVETESVATTEAAPPSFNLLTERVAPAPPPPSRSVPAIVTESFRRSPLAAFLSSCESASPLRLECQEVPSLEADIAISVRTGVVCLAADLVTNQLAQDPRIDLVRTVFKRFVVVVVATDSSTAGAVARHSAIAQLRATASCRGVFVAADPALLASELLAIAREDEEQGFALPTSDDASSSNTPTASGLDPHFHARFRFFASTNVLSIGSVASLSFRFDKFRVAQIPVAKFNEMHWRRMLPWVSEPTATQLYSFFLSKP